MEHKPKSVPTRPVASWCVVPLCASATSANPVGLASVRPAYQDVEACRTGWRMSAVVSIICPRSAKSRSRESFTLTGAGDHGDKDVNKLHGKKACRERMKIVAMVAVRKEGKVQVADARRPYKYSPSQLTDLCRLGPPSIHQPPSRIRVRLSASRHQSDVRPTQTQSDDYE